MNKYFDDSKLGEKIIDIILPSEVIYKEDKGESADVQLRHGRLDELYPNRKVINTRYANTPIIPKVKVYFRAFMDDDSVITIDIFNNDDNNLFKKFVINSKNNDYTLVNMKNICDDISTILTKTDDHVIVQLIEYIRNKENLKFEEIAQ